MSRLRLPVFDRASLRTKMTLVILAVSATVVVLAIGSLAWFDHSSVRRDVVRALTAQADVIGSSCEAALTFGDEEAGRDALQSLRHDSAIRTAALYDAEDEILARWCPHIDCKTCFVPDQVAFDGDPLAGSVVSIFRPILMDGRRIGAIFLSASPSRLEERDEEMARTFGSIAIVSVLLAVLLSSRLQRLISGPILDLTAVARRVTHDRDYAARAVR